MISSLRTYYMSHKEQVWVGLLLGVYIVLCCIPFFLYGSHPLGYDTGFYRRYLLNPVVSFPNTSVPGVDHTIIIPRLFLDMVRLLGFGPDGTLYGSYLFLLLGFLVTFYLFVREFVPKRIAAITLLFLVFSPVQYLAFWYMLYKNFFALIFFFLAFLFLRRRRYVISFFTAIMIPLSHQSTTIIFLTVLGTYIAVEFVMRKKILLQELVIMVGTLFVYLYLHPHVQQKIDAPPVGVFIEKGDFIIFSSPILILCILGFSSYWKVLKKEGVLFAFGCVAVMFPLLSLPYYQRIFLFSYYWLLLGAAFGISVLLAQTTTLVHREYAKKVLMAIFVLQGVVCVYQIHTLVPLIPNTTRKEIVLLQEVVPSSSFILTTPRLTPWVQGWTTAKVYAPGILKDTHPSWEWQLYWSGTSKSKLDFLASFPHPLYIVVEEDQKRVFLPDIPCIVKMSAIMYRDTCYAQ